MPARARVVRHLARAADPAAVQGENTSFVFMIFVVIVVIFIIRPFQNVETEMQSHWTRSKEIIAAGERLIAAGHVI